MIGADDIARVIDWPGRRELSAIFIAGAVLILIATLLLSLNRLRILSRVLGVAGVLVIMAALVVIHEQKVVEHPTPEITVARPKFPEQTRKQIRIALLGLPFAAAIVMASVFVATQRRQRHLVPGYLKRGLKHFYQQAYDEALQEYNTALSFSPLPGRGLPPTRLRLRGAGRIGSRSGRLFPSRGARSPTRPGFHPPWPDPHLAIRFRWGHRRLRTSGLDIRSSDAESYLNRGICMAKRGEVSAAVADLQRVLKLTNHSDFAEPAKEYLRELGVGDRLSLPDPMLNVATPTDEVSESTTQDSVR